MIVSNEENERLGSPRLPELEITDEELKEDIVNWIELLLADFDRAVDRGIIIPVDQNLVARLKRRLRVWTEWRRRE